MEENVRSDEAGEPWAFAIGQSVTVGDSVPGEVIWRRENQAGERDYLVRTAEGESWVKLA